MHKAELRSLGDAWTDTTTAHRRFMAQPPTTTSFARTQEVETEGGKGATSKSPPQSVNQRISSDCRKSAIPRASSWSRIISTVWRRSIQGEIALRKHDFISSLRQPHLTNGAHGASSVVAPYSRRYSAKLAAFSSTFNRVSQGAPSA